jgi:hypothetical protein
MTRRIRQSLELAQPAEPAAKVAEPPPALSVEGIDWLPSLLDRLADMTSLRPERAFSDPFAGAAEWRSGIVSRVYVDRDSIPTLGILPLERSVQETVLSALYGLSALKQAPSAPKLVRGVIFTPGSQPALSSLLHGLSNLWSIPFDAHVSLRN